MNLVGISVLSGLMLVVLFSPQRWALIAIVAGAMYLTQAQQVQLGGVNLFAVRFLEAAGFLRVLAKKEFSFRNVNNLDRSVLLLYVYSTVVFLLRSSEGYAYQIGLAVDAFFCYFTFRGLMRDADDFRSFLTSFLILLVPYVALTLIERLTAHNPFAFMGGIESDRFMRDGKPRCFGSFRHPSLLGTLGATFFPLYIGLCFMRDFRLRGVLGVFLSLLIVWASNSGGPLSACALAGLGWCFWVQRRNMSPVRWGIIICTAVLGACMKAPVWYLLARVSSLTGGDGWHRSYLIDVAVRNIDKWWLCGMPIDQTSDWFPYTVRTTGAADITNQFLVFGLGSGLGAVVLLIAVLTQAFKSVGRALTIAIEDGSRGDELVFWALGSMLVAHIATWLGISYFDQTYVIWFMQLATISSISDKCVGSVLHASSTIEIVEAKDIFRRSTI